MNRCIRMVDSTLRDGSHAVSHQFSGEQIAAVAQGLDKAGVPFIEASHGDGLGGSSINYGHAKLTDEEMLRAASKVIRSAALTVLLLPGIGTQEDLKMAADCGARAVRVATHVTEADIAEQHIGLGKKMGMTTFGFLMLAHMRPPEVIVQQAKLFESYGSDVIYIADSAGAMLPSDVKLRIEAVVDAVSVPIGFHAHASLGLAIANSLTAAEAGATYLDGTCRGLGSDRQRPDRGHHPCFAQGGLRDRDRFLPHHGCCRRHSGADDAQAPGHSERLADARLCGRLLSFLLHTYRAAEKYRLNPRDILVELGRREMVGGQEDMILDVAYEMAQQKEAAQNEAGDSNACNRL